MNDDSPRTPMRFTLAGLFELLTGIAIGAALVAQLGYTGWLMAVGGLIAWIAAREVMAARGRGQAYVGFLGCFVVSVLAAIVALVVILGEFGPGFSRLWTLLAAEVFFVAFSLGRRWRLARRDSRSAADHDDKCKNH